MVRPQKIKAEVYQAMREELYRNEQDFLTHEADEYVHSVQARIVKCGSVAGSKEFY